MPRNVAIAAICLALVLAACGGGDDPTPTPVDVTADEAQLAAEAAETDATMALVATRTEALFEVDGGAGPEITILDDDALASLIDDLLSDPEIVESIDRDEAFYSLLGLIPPDVDLAELNEELLNTGVAGLYRPEIDHLYVRLFGSFSALEESTASHEYAHYLQDVGYDLEAMFDLVAGDRDAELALRAVIEGDASYVQQQYTSEYFNEVQLFGMNFGGLLAAAEAPSVPYVFTRETTFVYLDGQRWMARVLARGADRAEVYANPPRTTSEILHPETYALTDAPEPVALDVDPTELPATWTTAAEPERIGELLLRTWLEELDARASVRGSTGWAGDALRVFHDGDDAVALLAVVRWAGAGDAAEFAEIAAAALDRHDDYEPTSCTGCPSEVWDGPAGLLAIEQSEPDGDETLLAVAPSVEELKQIATAVR